MESITKRLHENRQIQLAKEILESNGYEVKKLSDSVRSRVSGPYDDVEYYEDDSKWEQVSGKYGDVPHYTKKTEDLTFNVYDLKDLDGGKGFIVDCYDYDSGSQEHINGLCDETYPTLKAAQAAVDSYLESR